MEFTITELPRIASWDQIRTGFPDGQGMLLREVEFDGQEADVVVDESGAELVLTDGHDGWVIEREFATQSEAREFLESLPASITDPESLGFQRLKPR